MRVCHACDNPICVNAFGHLWLGTQRDNIRDASLKRRLQTADRHWTARLDPAARARGERHGRAKLADSDVLRVRDLYARGDRSYGSLAAEFEVSSGTIRDIVKRRRWTHLQ
jgi:hypothetical protein